MSYSHFHSNSDLLGGEMEYGEIVWKLGHDRERIESEIMRLVDGVRSTLTVIEQRIGHDEHLNELGELQGDGRRIDHLIGLRYAKIDETKRIGGMLNVDGHEFGSVYAE